MPGIVPRGTRLLEVTRFSQLDLEAIQRVVGEHYAEAYEKCRETKQAVRIVAEKLKMKLERFQLGMQLLLYAADVQESLSRIGLKYTIVEIVVYRAPQHDDRRAMKIVFHSPEAGRLEQDLLWLSDPVPAKS